MYILKRANIERVTPSDSIRDSLLLKGYKLLNGNNNNEDEDASPVDGLMLEEMDIEKLKSYAEENDIDLGRTTSRNGIIEKIKQSQL